MFGSEEKQTLNHTFFPQRLFYHTRLCRKTTLDLRDGTYRYSTFTNVRVNVESTRSRTPSDTTSGTGVARTLRLPYVGPCMKLETRSLLFEPFELIEVGIVCN